MIVRFIAKKYRELKRPRLNLAQSMELLAKINFKAPRKFVAEKFKTVDVDNNYYLDFEEFLFLLKLLRERPKVEELFIKHTKSNKVLSAEALLEFFQIEQGESTTT